MCGFDTFAEKGSKYYSNHRKMDSISHKLLREERLKSFHSNDNGVNHHSIEI